MLVRTLCLGLGLAAAGAVLMGQIQPAHAQAVVADVPPPPDCGPYGCVPEPGYVAPGYAAVEPGYVEETPGYVAPGYVEAAPGYVAPGYAPVDPGYAVAWGPAIEPDCHWKRGVLGRVKYDCDD
jgi:hypothetical protein